MELDELKKSWNKLNEHLEQKDLIDEQDLQTLIARHKQNTNGKINKIAGLGKLSVGIAGVFLLFMLACFIFIIPSLNLSAQTIERIYFIGGFFTLLLIAGGSWDLTTYLWLKHTDIETLSVVKVIERINRFRQWTKYEVIALIIVFISLTGIIYYIQEIYEKPLLAQTIYFVFCLLIIGSVIYIIYKKLVFKNLRDIRRNLEELQELKND